jgi:3-oxoacyl-[acyl-carrier protein] reductase
MIEAQPAPHGAAVVPDGSLRGRLVLVTGASRGIGAAIALRAARAGADVAVAYYEQAGEAEAVAAKVRELGGRSQTFGADLSDAAQARKMVAHVQDTLGPIHGLVNNAGIMPETPFLEIGDEEWNRVLSTDLTSAFACSQAVLPGMLERGSGSIVMISSRLGQIGFAGVAHYSVAKAGLIALAKTLAREFGPRGIRANAIAPGVVVTDMGAQVMSGEVGRKRMAELPLGRFGTAPEIAETAVFLLSDASSLFLGQTLNPNCGGYMP